MKIRFPLFLLIGLLGLSMQVSGQQDLRPGYVIPLEGDTLFGFVNYQRDAVMAKTCEFAETESSPVKTYGPGEIHSFRITDGKYYLSKSLDLEGLSGDFFLEYLVNAIVSAYYVQIEDKNHYLLEDSEGRFYLLKNEMVDYYTPQKSIGFRETKEHVGVMRWLFADHPGLTNKIDRAQLNHGSIISIVSEYHQFACPDEDCIVYEKETPSLSFRYGISAAVNWASFNLWDNDNIYPSFPLGSAIFPGIGGMVEMKSSRFLDRYALVLAAELGQSHHQAQTTLEAQNRTEELDQSFKTTYLKTDLMVQYTFPQGIIQPTLSAGLTLRHKLSGALIRETTAHSSSLGTIHGTQDIKIPNIFFGPVVALGANIGKGDQKKINLGLTYNYHYMTDWSTYSIIGSSSAMERKVRYFFSLHSIAFRAGYYF